MAIDDAMLRAMERFYTVLDTRIARLEQDHSALVCPEGCSICCVGNIFVVTALDFAYVCRHVKEGLAPDVIEEVVAIARRQSGECGLELALELEASDARIDDYTKQVCPLLHQSLCRVYPARPTPCRLFGRTRYKSGKLNVCDTIYERLPIGGNGSSKAKSVPKMPLVEDCSKALAVALHEELGFGRMGEVEAWLYVNTIPGFIAGTGFEDHRLEAMLPG